MIYLDGRPVREKILGEVKASVGHWVDQVGQKPGLAVILVGDDPGSQVYVKNMSGACDQVGIRSTTVVLPATTTQVALLTVIDQLNQDPSIHGILLQLPLPSGLDAQAAVAAIAPEKDVDGFHPMNGGRLMVGMPGVRPCTPAGVMAMLSYYGISCAGKSAVVVGRSFIVGKPMAMLLLAADATVTVAHSKTNGLIEILRQADLLVVAIGNSGFVTADMIKPGAIVVDVGINRVGNRVVGDVDPDVASVASALSPVPGGVGLLTVAMLVRNTGLAFANFHHLDFDWETNYAA